MNCDDLREDYEAYALGALEPDEARRVEAHIAGCYECAQIVRAYKIAVDHLALAVPMYHAPKPLKQRIMGGIGVFRPAAFLPAALRSGWWASAAAAVLVAVAVGGIAWAMMLSSQVDRLRDDNDRLAELSQLDAEQRSALFRLQGDLNSAKNEQQRMSSTLDEQANLLVIALDTELVPTQLEGTMVAPQARCNYVWSRNQALGALTCKEIPFASLAQTYVLWATKGEKNLPVGTFLPRVDGTAQLLVKFPADVEGPVSNLWVTMEPAGVSRTRPGNEIVLQRSPVQQAARQPAPPPAPAPAPQP